ncbi:hypothetical protein N7454_002887 [Penicillium verhagenii]|nr:hypothetical protein N7454_002887 [Penicillium verhagenii]
MSVNYGSYQNTVFAKGTLMGIKPTVTTDPRMLEQQAKSVLSEEAYNFVSGGAGEKATMDSNRLAFRQWKMIPRMMPDVKDQDVSVELFGQKYDTPLIVAPLGVQKIFHEDKDTGLAKVCAEEGIPFTMSTAGTSSIEELAEASGEGKRWYQLYWPKDNDVTASLLKRAKSSGFSVLVITLDCWTQGWRPADLDNGYIPFLKGTGCQVGFSDPVFRAKFEKRSGRPVEEDIVGAAVAWLADVHMGQPHTWEDIAFLKEHWDGPIVLKGIQHVEDAKLALQYGCEGIVVSNHGGRQVDGAIGSLDVLPEIVEAVGDQMTVLFDSGIRTGMDVVKALCLGAKAVMVGRPIVYGLSIDGKEGARQVIKNMLGDVWQNMTLSGIRATKDCSPKQLRRVNYGGDGKAMM